MYVLSPCSARAAWGAMAAPGPGSSDSQTQRSADSSSETSVGLEEVMEGNRMTHPPAVEKSHRVVLNGKHYMIWFTILTKAQMNFNSGKTATHL